MENNMEKYTKEFEVWFGRNVVDSGITSLKELTWAAWITSDYNVSHNLKNETVTESPFQNQENV